LEARNSDDTCSITRQEGHDSEETSNPDKDVNPDECLFAFDSLPGTNNGDGLCILFRYSG